MNGCIGTVCSYSAVQKMRLLSVMAAFLSALTIPNMPFDPYNVHVIHKFGAKTEWFLAFRALWHSSQKS